MDINGIIPEPIENELDRLHHVARPLAHIESQVEHIRHLTEQVCSADKLLQQIQLESQEKHIGHLTEQVCSADKLLQQIQQTEAYSRAVAEPERMLRQKHQLGSQAYAAKELEATIQRIEARDPRFWGDKHIPDRWTSFPPLQSLTFGPSQKDRIKALEERVRQLESMHKPSPPPPDNGANRSDGGQYL
jgi:hypothetical protein